MAGSKLAVIVAFIVTLVVMIYAFGFGSMVIQPIMNMVEQQASTNPNSPFYSWIGLYQTAWYWVPILSLGALILWLYWKGNEEDFDSNQQQPPII